VHQCHPVPERPQRLGRRGDGIRIAVQPHQPPAGSRGLQHRARMAAEPERGVAVDAGRARGEVRQDLVAHDGQMQRRVFRLRQEGPLGQAAAAGQARRVVDGALHRCRTGI
jgi:hypothetical protein